MLIVIGYLVQKIISNIYIYICHILPPSFEHHLNMIQKLLIFFQKTLLQCTYMYMMVNTMAYHEHI